MAVPLFLCGWSADNSCHMQICTTYVRCYASFAKEIEKELQAGAVKWFFEGRTVHILGRFNEISNNLSFSW